MWVSPGGDATVEGPSDTGWPAELSSGRSEHGGVDVHLHDRPPGPVLVRSRKDDQTFVATGDVAPLEVQRGLRTVRPSYQQWRSGGGGVDGEDGAGVEAVHAAGALGRLP